MLVLTRREHETVLITVDPSPEPQTIAVFIAKTHARRVKLGFSGPRGIVVSRPRTLATRAAATAPEPVQP